MEMNNTKKIKVVKYLMKNQSKDYKLIRYGIAALLTNNPTYKQLTILRDDIVRKDRVLKLDYLNLVNDMMVEKWNGKDFDSLNEFKNNYNLY